MTRSEWLCAFGICDRSFSERSRCQLPPSSRVGNHAYIRAAEWKGFIVLRWMSVEQWGGHVLQRDLEAFYQSALGHMDFRWLYIWTITDLFKNVFTSLVNDRNFLMPLVLLCIFLLVHAFYVTDAALVGKIIAKLWHDICNRFYLCNVMLMKVEHDIQRERCAEYVELYFLHQDLIDLWKEVFILNTVLYDSLQGTPFLNYS